MNVVTLEGDLVILAGEVEGLKGEGFKVSICLRQAKVPRTLGSLTQ